MNEAIRPGGANLTTCCERRRGVSYDDGLALQIDWLRHMRADPAAPQKIFFIEHLPVITLGRSGDGSALLVTREQLALRGVEFHLARRGGDITYHGPGQWTIYPLLRLGEFCRDLHRYLRLLEETALLFLRRLGLSGCRVKGRTGVWVEQGGRKLKIAAIGVAVSNWISFHGMAINIAPDLSAFRDLIVPCNIPPADGGVTSLAELTGYACDMDAVAAELEECFREVFGFAFA